MMNKFAHLLCHPLRFTNLVGTGGIGTGMFFLLEGDHTLGRNESRGGQLVPYKDYCKLHIISHYIAVLLGAEKNGRFQLRPIGKVGEDDAGRNLFREMEQTGMTMDFVSFESSSSTTFSLCFQYPDSSGGNITTTNGASELVSPRDITAALETMQDLGPQTVMLAVPEVPLAARIALLEEGRKKGAFNVSSLLVSEAEEFERLGGLRLTDLLSINRNEAMAIAGFTDENEKTETIVEKCTQKIIRLHSQIWISVTDGSKGSYGCSRERLEFVPSLPVQAIGTGGAGDAFLAGTIAGLAAGLPLLKGTDDSFFGETPLTSALELGTLVASLSVTSPDTIHSGLDARLLKQHVLSGDIDLSPSFSSIFP